MTYSKAHVILDAVQFAANADTRNFGQLTAQDGHTLTKRLALRILLTYLPESTPPSHYVELLQDLAADKVAATSQSQVPQPSKDLSEDDATSRVRKLRLVSLTTEGIESSSADELDKFIISRARRVDAQLGSLTLLQQLVEPFVKQSVCLKKWTVAVLVPLVRLDYEYCIDSGRAYSLEAFERLHGRSGVEALMARAVSNRDPEAWYIGRNIRGILGPWVLGEVWRRQRQGGADTSKLTTTDGQQIEELLASCWSNVYEWFLDLAKKDFTLALQFFDQWDGPGDVDYGGLHEGSFGGNALATAEKKYAQTGLAILYQCQDTALTTSENTYAILLKVAKVGGLVPPPDLNTFNREAFSSSLSSDYLGTISTVHLLPAELLEPFNPLTRPNSASLELTSMVLLSSRLLNNLGHALTLDRILGLALFGSRLDQWEMFRKILYGLNSTIFGDDGAWSEARHKFLWLRGWQSNGGAAQARHGLFTQVSLEDYENEILKILVTHGRYQLVSNTYCKFETGPLPKDEVEKSVLQVALAAYDNASNGNRTRGGIKKANEIISSLSSFFPDSIGFRQVSALILATHRLSFYSLTLQHGVPFLPVNIRVQSDPLSLIDKLLKQNPQSYTKLDDLLDIGRDLVRAGLIKNEDSELPSQNISEEDKVGQAERRITAKAIEASLLEDDFDTAYSYIVNRLSASKPQPSELSDGQTDVGQDVLWKAAYQAGRYQPGNKQGPSALRRLEQKMELLSQALFLAPASSLQEILTTWRMCEKDLNAALAQEAEEEQAWNARGERTIPGGFTREDIAPRIQKPREATRKALNEEAPMSLFDVTRSAAAALSKSAFPLRGQRQGIAAGDSRMDVNDQASLASPEGDGAGRIRKRDMVSNMVTGRLASGIGWVIGKSRTIVDVVLY